MHKEFWNLSKFSRLIRVDKFRVDARALERFWSLRILLENGKHFASCSLFASLVNDNLFQIKNQRFLFVFCALLRTSKICYSITRRFISPLFCTQMRKILVKTRGIFGFNRTINRCLTNCQIFKYCFCVSFRTSKIGPYITRRFISLFFCTKLRKNNRVINTLWGSFLSIKCRFFEPQFSY